MTQSLKKFLSHFSFNFKLSSITFIENVTKFSFLKPLDILRNYPQLSLQTSAERKTVPEIIIFLTKVKDVLCASYRNIYRRDPSHFKEYINLATKQKINFVDNRNISGGNFGEKMYKPPWLYKIYPVLIKRFWIFLKTGCIDLMLLGT